MKTIIKRIGFILLGFWLIGVSYRLFFDKPVAGMQYYTFLDAVIDGSLVFGIIFLIVSACIKKKDVSSVSKRKSVSI